MSEIQFDEGQTQRQFKSLTILGDSQSPKLVRLILKTGIVKDEKKAGNLLIAVTASCFILSAILAYLFIFGGAKQKRIPTPQEVQELQIKRANSEQSREYRNQILENSKNNTNQ